MAHRFNIRAFHVEGSKNSSGNFIPTKVVQYRAREKISVDSPQTIWDWIKKGSIDISSTSMEAEERYSQASSELTSKIHGIMGWFASTPIAPFDRAEHDIIMFPDGSPPTETIESINVTDDELRKNVIKAFLAKKKREKHNRMILQSGMVAAAALGGLGAAHAYGVDGMKNPFADDGLIWKAYDASTLTRRKAGIVARRRLHEIKAAQENIHAMRQGLAASSDFLGARHQPAVLPGFEAQQIPGRNWQPRQPRRAELEAFAPQRAVPATTRVAVRTTETTKARIAKEEAETTAQRLKQPESKQALATKNRLDKAETAKVAPETRFAKGKAETTTQRLKTAGATPVTQRVTAFGAAGAADVTPVTPRVAARTAAAATATATAAAAAVAAAAAAAAVSELTSEEVDDNNLLTNFLQNGGEMENEF